MIALLGDDFSGIASLVSTIATTGSKVGAQAIASDAQETVARDQADAASRIAVSRSTFDLALARLNAVESARTSESLVYGLSVAGILLALVLGLRVFA